MRLRLCAIWALFACWAVLVIGCQKDLDERAYDFACQGNADCAGSWECLPSDDYETDICQPPRENGSDTGDAGDVSDAEQDAADTSDASDSSDGDGGPSDTGDAEGDTDSGDADGCTETNEGMEQCDGVDNDCDGEIDEGLGFEAVDLAAGLDHICAIGADGSVYCWGDNTDGKALPGTAAARPDVVRRPVVNDQLTISAVDGLQIAVGHEHSCLLQDDRQISCWGSADRGRLGPGNPLSGTVNTFGTDEIRNFAPASDTLDQIEAGDSFTCVRSSSGDVYCWGVQDSYRYSDTATTGESGEPIAFDEMSFPADTLALGDAHGCAISGTDRAITDEAETDVHCWGDASDGKTGKDMDDPHKPELITDDFAAGPAKTQIGLTSLTLGATFTCGFNTSQLLCWGDNGDGQLAKPEGTAQSSGPVQVELPGDASVLINSGQNLAAGWAHGCVLDSDSNAYCWGYGAEGQLGHGESGVDVVERTPIQVDGARTFSELVAGNDFTCGIEGNAIDGGPGQVYCWGNNQEHQLGLGESGTPADSYNTPQPVACAVSNDET